MNLRDRDRDLLGITVFLLLICTSMSVFIMGTNFRVRDMQKQLHQIVESQKKVELIEDQQASHLYMVMDTEVRILHYSMPHKKQIQQCPECLEYWAHQQHIKREQEEGTDNLEPRVRDGIKPYLPTENPHAR